MLHPNDTIGPYTLIRLLGCGGFGEVWLAAKRSSLVSAPVALKLPLLDADAIETVKREAVHWLQASGHPNVVPFMDADVYDGQVVIASEFIAGGSLKDRMEAQGGKPWPPEEVIALIGGVLAGLDYLHRAGLTHRDLKPDNVLLQEGTPRLADFGLARVLKTEAHTGQISGTPRYMAPETFSGAYSVQSDLWAVGVLLYELLTGAHPFPANDLIALITAINQSEPTPLPSTLPPRLCALILRLLAKSPKDRLASASAVREALQSALRPDLTLADTRHPIPDALPPNNLPAPISSFIGREREIETVADLLADHRLVTLTGSGGCGKTRLALQVAERLLPRFPQGVWLAELAPLSDPAFVVSTVATALGVKEAPGQTLIKTLCDALKSRRLLLVLDNCEHVLAEAATLADTLLRFCPHMTLLASSREGLNIAGEQNFRVPSLALPDSAETDPDAVLGSESARLFVERAKAAAPSFAVSTEQAALLASIVRRLDGIPLAIELAAARTRSLSLEQLLTRLDDRFRLLTGGARTALPRQQTLRAMIDWSYGLLTEQEKSLFRRLSVFAGGWTLAAAEAVCSAEDIEMWEVLDALTALVDKSLVEAENDRFGTRYRFLETVRQYSRDRLLDSDEGSTIRTAHCGFFAALAEEAKPELQGPRQVEWLDRLETEHDNLRMALQWGRDDAGADAALRMCGALWRFWHIRGHWTEGRERCAAALSSDGGRVQNRGRADALNCAGNLSFKQSIYPMARAYHEESLAIRREIGDRTGIGASLNSLGVVALDQGDYASARAYYEESLTILRAIGSQNLIANSLIGLGIVANRQGDYASARACYEESLTICREIGDRSGISNSLGDLGSVALCQGDYISARDYYEESLTIRREIGDRNGIGGSLGNLGNLACEQRDYALARANHEESLTIFREIGNKNGIADSLESFAALAAVVNGPERAAVLWGAATALREAIGAPLPPNKREQYETAVATARAALGEEAFASAWERGKGMTMDEAAVFAVEETGTDPILVSAR